MNENEVKTNIGYEIAKEKLGDYHYKDNDFVGDRELTVTITLHEYRELITKGANAERDKIQSQLWEIQRKVSELEKENNLLKEMLKNGDVDKDD